MRKQYVKGMFLLIGGIIFVIATTFTESYFPSRLIKLTVVVTTAAGISGMMIGAFWMVDDKERRG